MTVYYENDLYEVVEGSEVGIEDAYALINKGNRIIEGKLSNLPNAIEAALLLNQKMVELQSYISNELQEEEEELSPKQGAVVPVDFSKKPH